MELADGRARALLTNEAGREINKDTNIKPFSFRPTRNEAFEVSAG